MYNKIRNQILYLLSFRSIMFLVLIFLLPILACTVTSSGNEATGNEENGNEDSGWFSNEPDNNDLKQVWDYTRVSDDFGFGTKDVEVLQIWENTRKDYWAESVDISIFIYANDGSVIDSDTETIVISAGGTYIVEFGFSGIGTKINRIETAIDNIYWQNSDSDRVGEVKIVASPSLSQLSPDAYLMNLLDVIPNLNITEPVIFIENKSDYIINDVQFSVLACTKDEEYCVFQGSSHHFDLVSGQSRSLSRGPLLQEKIILSSLESRLCQENNPNLLENDSLPNCFLELIDKAESISYQYWVTYTTHFGELVSIEGEIK